VGRLVTYECPSCVGRFEEYHHAATEAPPRFCKLCGFDNLTVPDELAMPHLGRPVAKSVDSLHRAMEEGAEWRSQKIQEDFGATPAEANGLKMTNMRDGMREGDVAAVPVDNAVSQQMVMQGGLAPVGAQPGLEYSRSVPTGFVPNAGVRAVQGLRGLHGSQEHGLLTETPALEVTSPMYRPRTR
jgi:hypothetical protein